MNLLFRSLNTEVKSRRSACPHPFRARPALEQLESRRLLSVSYHGGPLLQHVEVETVYYGPDWQNNPGLAQRAQQLDQFFNDIANSPYLDMLGEYSVGRGGFRGHDFNAAGPVPGQTIQSSDIIGMVVSEIAQGRLPIPDANSVYFVFLPPQVTVSDLYGYPAYHGGSGATAYGNFALSIVAQPVGMDPLNAQTLLTSHELAECATDPVGGGWYDDSLPAQGEIGDLCNGQAGTFHGYVVQKIWSNSYQTGILPMPSNLSQTANGISRSDEYFANLIEGDYQQLLGRIPSPQEVDGWIQVLQQGVADEQVLAGFASSPEYFQRAQDLHQGGPFSERRAAVADQFWLEQLYQDLLQRAPDAAGEASWLQALASGVSRVSVAYAFATSYEHEALVVQNDYQHCLGRTAGGDEVARWVSVLQQGMTNEQVAAAMVTSPEAYYFEAQSENQAWITHAYYSLLHRAPDDGGFQYWLGFLDSGE